MTVFTGTVQDQTFWLTAVHSLTTLPLNYRSPYRQCSYGDRQGAFGKFFVQHVGAVPRCGPPAGVHWPAEDPVPAAVRHSASAPTLAVSSVLRQTKALLLDAASLLELDVDGILVYRGDMDAHSVSSQLGPQMEEQAAKLLLESLVKVEVDERVVDVGAFGEEGGEHETLWSHVLGLLVEDEEEGHDGVRRPGNHKTKADAEKHLKEEVADYRRLLHWKCQR